MPTTEKRTEAIYIYTPKGGPDRLEILRETRVEIDGGSLPVPNGGRRVRLSWADLANQPLPGGSVLVATYADLRALIALMADHHAEADEAAEAARLAALAEQEGQP